MRQNRPYLFMSHGCDIFVSICLAQFNQSAGKGKQLMSGCSKSKTATQTGYFSDQFMRVMDGEAYSDQVKMRRQFRLKEAQKNIGKPFVPSSGEKKP